MSNNTLLNTTGPRHEQTFPVFNPLELEILRGFGKLVQFRDREPILTAGQKSRGLFVILDGHATVQVKNIFGQVTPIAEYGPGGFIGETGNLSGRTALVDGHAEGETQALLIEPDRLRSLLIANAEIGERIMRALILRRVNLIEGATVGPTIIGPEDHHDVVRLQGFFRRNGHPFVSIDPSSDEDAAELLKRSQTKPTALPLVILADGTILENPTSEQIASILGMMSEPSRNHYDVAVVGAGPSGLSTAVYAASEGLTVAVCDARSFGGQAGASARIENYFGFPTGISGFALTARAYSQAQKFGAEMMIPTEVKSLDCTRPQGYFVLKTADGHDVRARSIVLASGAYYRRPDIAGLKDLEGRGVWYWASPIEANLCKDQDIYLVGGGNSAGQAVVYLASHARSVQMLVRGESLAASMSSYLIDRIQSAPNVTMHYNTEIDRLESDGSGLAGLSLVDRTTGKKSHANTRNLFLFIGADPATGWLAGCGVSLDQAGFVTTGASEISPASQELETSVHGVFAIGDVRSGSTKRVGAAIGEGAQVVAALHRFLSLQPASVA
ncbi:cyclic nucleotide-binding domain-containing thioredoxin-disulfide reductase [Rhizobium sp. SG570]|uniref:FAD-dependent oxidoreductase n=1 Tax=Rhizobium sp. SG570 TaxID=2587113 RepID=UPI001446FAA5|nr:cyclic nucleotide-binding domain-containing thioredoxin-disulfide reductase [Rhizobium sp. SG570]NKJ38445.1 thioredoxin reductase (NADPH) [Rhizobium sp. SG570]